MNYWVSNLKNQPVSFFVWLYHCPSPELLCLAWKGNKMKEPRVKKFYNLRAQLSFMHFGFPWYFPWLIIHTRFMLLHDSRNDDGIKSFFQEVHELYIKVICFLYCSISYFIDSFSLLYLLIIFEMLKPSHECSYSTIECLSWNVIIMSCSRIWILSFYKDERVPLWGENISFVTGLWAIIE